MEKKYTSENTYTENEIVFDKETKKPINGTFTEKQFASDNIRLIIPYVNGKEHGILKSFYNSGNLRSEMPYLNGKEEGIQKDYYESGKLQTTSCYANNMLNGIQNWYYENGQLKAEYHFKDNSGVDSLKAYYENGNIFAELAFKGGNLKGGFKYDENGTKKKVTSFIREMDKFLFN